MPKNIVVLSDGTGQEGGKAADTNVYKLFKMLENRTGDQVVFYDRGLGTAGPKITGQVGGLGISKNILDCYSFIFENYHAGDNLFLFGFSRGATTVRSLSSFIHYFGILPKSRPELIKRAYRVYKNSSGRRLRNLAQRIMAPIEIRYDAVETQDRDAVKLKMELELREQLSGKVKLSEEVLEIQVQDFVSDYVNRYLIRPHRPFEDEAYWATVKERITQDLADRMGRKVRADDFVSRYNNMWTNIRFLGVWDTVAALGLPYKALDVIIDQIPYFHHSFQNLSLSKTVEHGRHALAIDDERKTFHPELWDEEIFPHQTMKQVWFTGMHTDVGGGYADTGLSDTALTWMVSEAVDKGLRLFDNHKVCIAPDPNDWMEDSRRTTFTKLFRKKIRSWDYEGRGNPVVHQAVKDRQLHRQIKGGNAGLKEESNAPYDPWILKKGYQIEPWPGEQQSFRGLELTEKKS